MILLTITTKIHKILKKINLRCGTAMQETI